METRLRPQSGPLTLPPPSTLNEPFWDGCARGELRFVRCRRCGAPDFPAAPFCRACQSEDLTWEAGAGTGSVYSWTVVHRPATPQLITPYAPAIIDLDEGNSMLSNLVDLDVADVSVGLRVSVVFHRVADDRMLPYFAPAS
jgi:uncharacterized OB-fold protein